jgi:hypothetical protein
MRCPCASDNRIVNKLARQKSLLLRGQLIGEVTGNVVIEEGSRGWRRRDEVRGQRVGEVAASRRVVGSGWSQRVAHWGGSTSGRRAAAAASRRAAGGGGVGDRGGVGEGSSGEEATRPGVDVV